MPELTFHSSLTVTFLCLPSMFYHQWCDACLNLRTRGQIREKKKKKNMKHFVDLQNSLSEVNVREHVVAAFQKCSFAIDWEGEEDLGCYGWMICDIGGFMSRGGWQQLTATDRWCDRLEQSGSTSAHIVLQSISKCMIG